LSQSQGLYSIFYVPEITSAVDSSATGNFS